MKHKASWDFVIQDMRKRHTFGLKKYKIPLTSKTKKDMIQELYEELLDSVVYIKTYILQRNKKNGN